MTHAVSTVGSYAEISATQRQISAAGAYVEINSAERRVEAVGWYIEGLIKPDNGVYLYYNGTRLYPKTLKLEHTVDPIDTSTFLNPSTIAGRHTWLAEFTLFWSNQTLFTTVLETQIANNLLVIEYVDDNAKVVEYNNEAFVASMNINNTIDNAINASVKIVGSGTLTVAVTQYT